MIPFSHYRESAEHLRARLEDVPRTAVVLGSGLDRIAEELADARRVPYAEIPHFPRPAAPGHAGILSCGLLSGVPVLMLSGRLHCYEGYSMAETAYYVRVLRLLGVTELILTNAAGAVNPAFAPGDVMLVRDHIKLTPESPLTGEWLAQLGPMFFDMTRAYDPGLCGLCRAAAREAEVPLREGIYFYFAGPQYETPAEVRAARLLGADAVGMSTVPEIIAAASCGMRAAALSLITNPAAGTSDSPPNGDEVLAQGRRSCGAMAALVRALVRRIAESRKGEELG